MTVRANALVLAVASLAGCAAGPTASPEDAAPAYPHTRTVDVVDDYHGTQVADPYRWLEDTSSSEVRTWAAAQNALTDRHLSDDPLRASLPARFRALAALPPHPPEPPATTQAKPVELSIAESEDRTHRVLNIRRNGGEPAAFVDPKRFGADLDITDFHASPDDRHVAYVLYPEGSEWGEMRIRRTSDGKDFPEVLKDMLWARPAWTRDGESFFYVRYRRPAPESRTLFQSPAIFHHHIGTPQSADHAIFETSAGTAHLALSVKVTPDGRYALIGEGEGAHVDEIGWLRNRRWLLDLRDPLKPDISGMLVPLTADRDSAYELVGQDDARLYFLTDRDAPRRRLVAVDARAPASERWRDVIPQSDEVLQTITEVHGRWVAIYLHDVQHRVRVFDRAGRLLRTLDVPPHDVVTDVQPGPDASQFDVSTTSWFRPAVVTRHDVTTGTSRIVRKSAAPTDTSAYEARQVWYRSKDGTRVPMFVLNRKGIALDGSHPTLLVGYGASGQPMLPVYDEGVLAWLELGGVLAFPNLRGGGEFGRTWYEAAILDRKQTTFDDFIAAAEWLIAERYTSPARLAIRGSSNGGLLVAATLSQRPELFAAAIPDVPGVDMLRFDYGRHRAQFGDARDPAQFPFLFAYAPLQRIRPGTCYPATMVRTALNDDRVPAWNAFKLTAALQAAQSCARPVLLRVHAAGGHQGNRGPDAWIADVAEEFAFLAHALGMATR